jgi:toxin ParE1/3/4
MRVEHHPAVELELAEIRDFYNERVPGLGGKFLEEFDQQIQRVALMPTRWMVVERDIRRALMRRFPYVIYFRIAEADLIRVTAIKHEKRHPRLGGDRL